ncbi:MAG TPA: DUF3443 domain-containing protein [Terriglobales bacterium]|jgi:hypothetical protein|nr:DUF3443 domain-containing protein [Terriglobales bacterium]
MKGACARVRKIIDGYRIEKKPTKKGIATAAACGALLFAGACGGGSSPTTTQPPPPTGSNVATLTVNAGPAGNYANGAFTSVTVCSPGTSTCQTIDGVLVDTGSSGLRLLSSVLTVSLPQQNSTDGNPVAECLPFVIGYTWGPVQMADVEIASEKGSSVPVQVINQTAYPLPSTSLCADNPGGPADTVQNLGANGIIGVGSFAQDCGGACALPPSGGQNPNLYYECPAAGCTAIAESLTQQVANPVALFSVDNNGVIIELPKVSGPETSLTGSLVFGIGTESNNGLNGATVYPVDDNGNFITTFDNVPSNQSFLDSGSNAFYFSDPSIPVCGDDTAFYCPNMTLSLSATNAGYNGTPTGTVNFGVANADDLPNEAVLGQLAGPNTINGFDWGLPFFYGRNVYTAIQGKSTPGGTGPYWAY